MPMRMGLWVAAGWIVTVAALGASAQQQPSPVPGTFRSTVTLVPVDVRVLDRDGRAITDLTQNDFTLFENVSRSRSGSSHGIPSTVRQPRHLRNKAPHSRVPRRSIARS